MAFVACGLVAAEKNCPVAAWRLLEVLRGCLAPAAAAASRGGAGTRRDTPRWPSPA